ncbi:MAG: hypothetical protein Q9M37_03845 [Desulfonauticus sp.]|nr:hypothetical protein [Desulfonauticus sp.]
MSQANDASVSSEIKKLEQEIQKLQAQVKECEQQIRDYREKENYEQQIFFAQEIFQLQQQKLVLQTEITMRKNKINRLLFEHS